MFLLIRASSVTATMRNAENVELEPHQSNAVENRKTNTCNEKILRAWHSDRCQANADSGRALLTQNTTVKRGFEIERASAYAAEPYLRFTNAR